jgi:hypothetical protein
MRLQNIKLAAYSLYAFEQRTLSMYVTKIRIISFIDII